jgi:inosine/xanthosine triphosphate pyrophosphatase family protein
MAELDLEEKNAFSHRAMAVKKAIPYLLNYL